MTVTWEEHEAARLAGRLPDPCGPSCPSEDLTVAALAEMVRAVKAARLPRRMRAHPETIRAIKEVAVPATSYPWQPAWPGVPLFEDLDVAVGAVEWDYE